MKKRLLALLTVVLLLSITAVSSFALVPNKVPPMKEYFPDEVDLYPSNASQNYNGVNEKIWKVSLCPLCEKIIIYTDIVEFPKMEYWIDEQGMSHYYLRPQDVCGLYSVNHYKDLYILNGLIFQVYIDENVYSDGVNEQECAYINYRDTYRTRGDIKYINDEWVIAYHTEFDEVYDYETSEFNFETRSNVAMVVPKYDKTQDDLVEFDTYKNVYGSFKSYVHGNSGTLTYLDMHFLSYNTVSYSVYQKSIYDNYLGVKGGYESGYNEGFTEGAAEGYNNGYTTGNTEGYNNGYDEGYEKGLEESNKSYLEGYNEGRIMGQSDATFFDNGFDDLLERFFNSFDGFIEPFLALGWGTLTVGSLIGMLLTFIIVLIIVKVVRG